MSVFNTLFFLKFVGTLQVYPNLGIVLSPRPNLLTFDAFAYVDAKLIVRLPNLNKFNVIFNETCVLSNLKDDQQKYVQKVLETDVGTIFHDAVSEKLQAFSYQYISKVTRGRYRAEEIYSRDERQVLELFSVGMTLAYLGGELIHNIFGTSTAHKIKELESNVQEITRLRNYQINDLYTKIEELNCKTNKQILIEHQNMVELMVRSELEKIDEILFSIHYRVGLNDKVHQLMRKSCILATYNYELCEDLITGKYFSLKIKDVYTTNQDEIKFSLEMLFPTGVVQQNAYDLHNFGYLSEGSDGVMGRRISNLDNIDTVLEPLELGIDKNRCLKLDHFYLCSQEIIRPNYFGQNMCLNSIKRNRTDQCEFSDFQIKRPCLIHKIGQTPLIAAAINYKLIQNMKDDSGKITLKTTKGLPGLYPLNISKFDNVQSITLICRNQTKFLMLEPLVLNEPMIINSVPRVTPLNGVLNTTFSIGDEIKINDLINQILDSEIVKNISHRHLVLTGLITLLLVSIIVLCVLSQKFRNYCKKIRDIELA